MEVTRLVEKLKLIPHPEGGYYKEIYRSRELIKKEGLPSRFTGDRSFCTSIYYLLQSGDFSAFHRIKADELWHFYEGDLLAIHEITISGVYKQHLLGRPMEGGRYQVVIPAGSWFASEPKKSNSYCLCACTVAPGFEFEDFEMAMRSDLINEYPDFEEVIIKMTRQ